MLWISLIEVNPETERWAIRREFPNSLPKFFHI